MHDGLEDVARTKGHSDVGTGILVDVCFLMGLDEEAMEVNTALTAADSRGMRGLRHPVVADLSQARMERDATQAQAVVDYFDAAIARDRESFSDIAPITFHDWLEIALVAHSQLSGEPSPRLREV